MRLWIPELSVLFMLACKDVSIDPRYAQQLSQIEQEQQRRRIELAAIRAQIASSQEALREAEARLQHARCTASNGEWRARAARGAAECSMRHVQHSQCLAVAARNSSQGSILGILAGSFLAVATGGAAAPFALGGAMMGAAAGDNSGTCGAPPPCQTSQETTLQEILAARGLSQLPDCGPRPAGASALCELNMNSSFHLRPQEVLASVGPQHPVGERVAVLDVGSLRRRSSTLYFVRTPNNETGWVFLSPEELSAASCPWWMVPPPPTVVPPAPVEPARRDWNR